MTPRATSRLHYGDVVKVVGDRGSLDRLTKFLGNSAKSLKETRFTPLFIGITIGLVVGMVPSTFPAFPFRSDWG